MNAAQEEEETQMAKVAIAYHSGYGHTRKQAEAVRDGASSVPGVEATLVCVTDGDEKTFTELNQADAIIFGAPTYMGGPSAQFKKFADATSKVWPTQTWKNKVAGGFTNSASFAGDKGMTLHYFVTLAMQHSMIWVGMDVLPANTSKSQRNDLNRVGSFIGPWRSRTPTSARTPRRRRVIWRLRVVMAGGSQRSRCDCSARKNRSSANRRCRR